MWSMVCVMIRRPLQMGGGSAPVGVLFLGFDSTMMWRTECQSVIQPPNEKRMCGVIICHVGYVAPVVMSSWKLRRKKA